MNTGAYLLLDGLVVKDISGFFSVETSDGQVYICRLRGRLLEEAQASDIAAIGDHVKISLNEDGTGTIEEVAERSSVISRAGRSEGNRGAGGPEREQVIIANVDQVLFVFAAAQPAPSPRMLDRFLVMGEKAELERMIIVLNKADLDQDGETRKLFSLYERIGYPVMVTSAIQDEGVDALRDVLRDKISVFTGPSGVGKTSLLNQIQSGLGRAVKNVSNYSQEGMHTTRSSEMIKLDFGGYLADTPGVRTLSIWDVEPEELDAYFVEIAEHIRNCRFTNCTHRSEPGCAVRQAVEQGHISRSRYQSYLALHEELEASYAI